MWRGVTRSRSRLYAPGCGPYAADGTLESSPAPGCTSSTDQRAGCWVATTNRVHRASKPRRRGRRPHHDARRHLAGADHAGSPGLVRSPSVQQPIESPLRGPPKAQTNPGALHRSPGGFWRSLRDLPFYNCPRAGNPGRSLPLVALVLRWRQDCPNNRPPTRATATAANGLNRSHHAPFSRAGN
jgi:hypothetical protein